MNAALRVSVCAVMTAFAALGVQAASPDEAAQRASIQQQREEATARHAQRKAECAKAFAVNACEDQARTQHRQEMRRLREHELQLDDAERQRKAEAKRERLRAKAEAAQAGASAPASLPREAKAPPARPQPKAKGPGRKVLPKSSRLHEDDERARFESRQREVEAHRQNVERRNAARAAKRSEAAKPLPVPPGASGP